MTVNIELDRMWKELTVALFKVLPLIRLDGLRIRPKILREV
jgi:hypothetical protein